MRQATSGGGGEISAAVLKRGEFSPQLAGKLLYYFLPIRRRVVLTNLRRVFYPYADDTEIRRLAQAYYGHMARSLVELARFSVMPPEERAKLVRVENAEIMHRLDERGKGALVLTGHFGNWEVATLAAAACFPQYKKRFHILRRPLKPAWFDRLVTKRMTRAGLDVIARKGSLDNILQLLAQNDTVCFIMDQHASGREGVRVDFFGHPACTFRSLAVIALATGTPVVPGAGWRNPDGSHVMRFEEPLEPIEADDPEEAIRANTRLYNSMLERFILRHPEQWIWMHRRWKPG